MKYLEFINTILNSRENSWFEGSECHHIKPRCLGGTWDDGYVYLTPEEHFLAHKLLVEENPGNSKLAYALWRMTNDGSILTPEDYEYSRKKFSEAAKHKVLSEEHRRKLVEASRGRVFSEETRNKLREANLGKVLSEEHKKKISDSRKGKYAGENNSFYGRHHTEESKKKIRENRISYLGEGNPNYGKHHTEETKQRMRENRDLHGEGNPSYGTVCINNGIINKRISPKELEEYLSQGWFKGMLKYKRREFRLLCKNCGSNFLGTSSSQRYCPDCRG